MENDEKIQAHLLSVWRQTKKLFSFWGVEGMLFLTDRHLMFVNKTEAKMKWWKTVRERQGVTLLKSKNVMIHHDGYKEEDLKKDLENKKNLEIDFDNILNIDHRDWIYTGKWLIEQDKFQFIGERTGNFYPSSFAARKRYSIVFTDMGDLKIFEQSFQLVQFLLAIEIFAQLQYRHDIVLYREISKYRGFLR